MFSDYPKQNITLYATVRVEENGVFTNLPALFDEVVYKSRKHAVYADPLSVVLADVDKFKNCPSTEGGFLQRLRKYACQFENVYVFSDLSTLENSGSFDTIVIQHITEPGGIVKFENCISLPGYTPEVKSMVCHFNGDFVNTVFHYQKSQ